MNVSHKAGYRNLVTLFSLNFMCLSPTKTLIFCKKSFITDARLDSK